MFILRTKSEDDLKNEVELRTWLRNELGDTDEALLAEWVWDKSGQLSIAYIDALTEIVRDMAFVGREMVEALLSVARKPKYVRELEADLAAWAKVALQDAVLKVRQYDGAEEVAAAEFNNLCYRLEDKLYNMFPDKHRATMKGIMISAFVHQNGKFSLDIPALVEGLLMTDPLSVTAKSSR